MSWLAIRSGRQVLARPAAVHGAPDQLVPRGTLLIEAAFTARRDRPQVLLDLNRAAGWPRGFRVTLRHDGELFVEQRQGPAVTCALLDIARPVRDAMLRLTVHWNGPARRGLLSAENLETGDLSQVYFDDPQPWPMDDVEALAACGPGCRVDGAVTLLAIADHAEAVGLPAGLRGDMPVETAGGMKPVEALQRGDLVLTAERGWQPVRFTVTRELPAAGRFAPIRLLAPFFGLRSDLVVAPDHRILIDGADAEYLFGADAVLVEARHLAGMSAGARAGSRTSVTYVQVVLDHHDSISAGGTWVESLYMGSAASRPRQLAADCLSGIPPRDLPQHAQVGNPLLKSYEAVVLVSALCA